MDLSHIDAVIQFISHANKYRFVFFVRMDDGPFVYDIQFAKNENPIIHLANNLTN